MIICASEWWGTLYYPTVTLFAWTGGWLNISRIVCNIILLLSYASFVLGSTDDSIFKSSGQSVLPYDLVNADQL